MVYQLLNSVFKKVTYINRSGIAWGLKRRGGLGFIPRFRNRNYQEIEFLRKQKYQNNTIYDVGSNIGMYTLFFASNALPDGIVYSFEPNQEVFKELLLNCEINGLQNIKTFNLAVGSKNAVNKIVYDPTHKGTGSLSKSIQESFIKSSKLIKSQEVKVVSLDNMVYEKGLKAPDFVKIDVEGYEINVLNGMMKIIYENKPKLYIELHGSTKENKYDNIRRIFLLLREYDYNIEHIESGKEVSIDEINKYSEGHLFCI